MDVARARVVTVLHYYSTGPGQELHGWLTRHRARESVLIEHPFGFSRRKGVQVQRSEFGEERGSKEYVQRVRWAPLRYALDVWRTVSIVARMPEALDVYVGCGCINAAPGVVLRWLGKVRRVVMYTIDYVPDAHGRWIAPIYRWLDRWCCYRCDAVWNLARTRMREARERNGLKAWRSAPQLWVPHGTHAPALLRAGRDVSGQYRVAFFGHVKESSGIQLFVEAMRELRGKYAELRLEVIGDGPYRGALEGLVKREGLEDAVTFHGYCERHEAAEELLMQCGIGVALYRRGEGDYSEYTDPGKPRVYLGCGLPVIIGDVPEVAAEIVKRRAGVAVAYTREALLSAVETIYDDYTMYRRNALAMAAEYTWERVFARAWGETWGEEGSKKTE